MAMNPPEPMPEADDGALAQMGMREARGCWRCVYCGNVVSSDQSPTMAACCGEVGHNAFSESCSDDPDED